MSEVYNASKERLTEIYHTVLAIQNQIKTLDQEVLFSQSDEKAVTKELELIEQYHGSIEAFIKNISSKITSSVPSVSNCFQQSFQSSPTPFSTQSITTKLPKLEIKTFSGNRLEWNQFWDTFRTTIHESSLSEIEKFNYLLSYLSGDALKLLNGLPRNNENYKVAIDLLKDSFGNKQVLLNLHMNRLFELKSCYNSSQLKPFFDCVNSNIRSLKELGVDTSQFDMVLAPLLLSKLPYNIKRSFVKQQGNNALHLDDLMTFLHDDIMTDSRCNSLFGSSNSSSNYKPNQYLVKNIDINKTNKFDSQNRFKSFHNNYRNNQPQFRKNFNNGIYNGTSTFPRFDSTKNNSLNTAFIIKMTTIFSGSVMGLISLKHV